MLESKLMPNQSDGLENSNTNLENSPEFSAREKRYQELRLWVPVFLADWLNKMAHENFYNHRNKYVTHLLMELYRRAHGR